jgi:anti-anti-sigma regulatory factor
LTDAVFDPKSLSGTTGATPIGAAAAAPGDELQTGAAVEPAGEQHNSCAPLKIKGDLTIAAATPQHATLAGIIGQGSEVALDLSGIHECDTAGLQLIYSLQRSILQRKELLQIVAVSPEIQELAAALGLQIQELSHVRDAGAVDANSPSRSTTGGL